MSSGKKILIGILSGFIGSVLAGYFVLIFFHSKKIETSDFYFLLMVMPFNCSGFFGMVIGVMAVGFFKDNTPKRTLILCAMILSFTFYLIFLLSTNWMIQSGFFAAHIRSKVSMVKSYQQHIASELQYVYSQQTSYPLNQMEFEKFIESNDKIQNSTKDPFHNHKKEHMIYFSSSNREGYIIISYGPNQKMDIPIDLLKSTSIINEYVLIDWTYDPTNGTVSYGDIWRIIEK